MRLLRLLPALLVVLAAFVVLPAGAGHAADTDYGRMMLVMDSSGSMAEPAGDGTTKIAAARQALDSVIGDLPDEAYVGLRVFGSTVFSRNDPGACADTQVAVPPGTDNRAELSAAVDSYKPYGETPIPAALRAAAADLGSEGERSIVLVSDGESTCQPDPCDVAAEIAQQGIDLQIDVVGLSVSGKARSQLQCIARRGGGTYHDADSAADVVDALDAVAERAVHAYRSSGTPVSGTATAVGAPVVTAGAYADEIGGPGTTTGVRNYTVKREMTGSTLHVSASIQSPLYASGTPGDQQSDGLDVRLISPQGSTCDYATGVMYSSDGPIDPVGLDSTRWSSDECAAAPTLTLRVARAENVGQNTTTPLEVQIVEEPPAEEVDDLPPGVEIGEAEWHDPTSTAGEPSGAVVGGSSFSTATPVEPGSYTGTLVPGEVQLFRVDVDWGQQLTATAAFPAPGGPLAEQIDDVGADVALHIYSPAHRDAVVYTEDSSVTRGSTVYPSQGATIGGTTAPVRYRNREVSDEATEAAAIAGTYTVAVSLADDRAKRSYEYPFTLNIGRTGTVEGAPAYAEGELAGASSSPSPGSETGESPSDEPSPEATATSHASGRADGERGDPASTLELVAATGLGTVGLVALAGAVVLLLRRRRAQP